MSLIVAISAADRIVLASDGLVRDSNTDTSLELPKLFELTQNTAVGIAGSWLRPDVAAYMKSLSDELAEAQLRDAQQVAGFLETHIHTRDWAHNDDSEIELLVAGYSSGRPLVRLLQKQGTAYPDPLGLFPVLFSAYAIGSWDGARAVLRQKLGYRYNPNTVRATLAEKIARDVISQGARNAPTEIGGTPHVWQIFKDRLEKI